MVFHDIPVQVKIFEKENNFPLVRVVGGLYSCGHSSQVNGQ